MTKQKSRFSSDHLVFRASRTTRLRVHPGSDRLSTLIKKGETIQLGRPPYVSDMGTVAEVKAKSGESVFLYMDLGDFSVLKSGGKWEAAT